MNKTFYGTASITCSNRKQIINHSITVGPGGQDVYKQKNHNSLPKWTLKPRIEHGSCFQNTKQNMPPPGKYNIAGDIKHKVKLLNPNYRSDKNRQTTQKFNHMSNINLPSSLNQTMSASFGYRGQSILFKDNTNSPGPIYHVHKKLQQSRSHQIKNTCRGFGYGQKNGIYKIKNIVPGPGAYNNSVQKSPQKSLSPKSTFSKSKRQFYVVSNPLGPGQYNPLNNNNFTNSGRTFKFKGKLPEAMKFVNPNGPGSYDLPDTKSKKGPKFNNPLKSRSSEFDQMPNPFTYEFKRYPQNIQNQKGFSLGKRINQNQNQLIKNPGPGTYQVTQDLSKLHLGGYMGHKISKKKKNIIDDCFGKYDPNINISMRQGAMYSFSYDPKPWNKPQKDQTIGPGYYQLKQNKRIQGYKMGTSARFQQPKVYQNVLYNQQNSMYSTIGYLPSYLKKQNSKVSKIRKNLQLDMQTQQTYRETEKNSNFNLQNSK